MAVSLKIRWIFSGKTGLIEHMDVNHSGGHIDMIREFLHRADVMPRLKQRRGKGVSQGMAADLPGNCSSPGRLLDGWPERYFLAAMPVCSAISRAHEKTIDRNHIQPAPFPRSQSHPFHKPHPTSLYDSGQLVHYPGHHGKQHLGLDQGKIGRTLDFRRKKGNCDGWGRVFSSWFGSALDNDLFIFMWRQIIIIIYFINARNAR